MNFSEKLQVIRKSRGLTQEELAEELQISRQAVAKWESGISYPDILNLIALSKLFHITVDYLVKDEECSKPVCQKTLTDKEELIAFRLEANRNTYAGHAAECTSSRCNSHDYCYEKDGYRYYDTWLGGAKFSGEEVVWKDNQEVYSMNYFGRTLDERFSGDFLKEALCAATEDMPYRGPELFQLGEYTYQSKVVGDLEWFQGYEEIYCNEVKVYECYYHGGILEAAS